MPGHGGIVFTDHGAPEPGHRGISDPRSHAQFRCPHCSENVNAAVIAETTSKEPIFIRWLRCTACHCGVVENNGERSPWGLAGEDVLGLPEGVASAYLEARKNASSGAYTSCELMCRKLLMSASVDKGAPENQSFAQYLDFLESSGYINAPMKPWVDHIRKRGNIATHELPATDEMRAAGTLMFTTQLLRLIYEMDHKVQEYLSL